MWVKLLGSMMVCGASGYIGWNYARNCALRPKQLRQLQAMLQVLQNEISFLACALPEAFDRTCRNSKDPVAAFFILTSEQLKKGEGIAAGEAWEKAVEQHRGNTALDAEDEGILKSFGKLLGCSDVEGQIQNIQRTCSHLKIQEQKSEERRKRYESLYRALGFLGGLALVILLF